jgi:PBP1b-binding outer membrane lipoprotein LpoB
MKNLIALIVLVLLFASCSRSVTPYEAANKHYKRCQSIR